MLQRTPSLAYTPAVIAISGNTSAEIDLQGNTVVGVHMPAAFTGTSITFQAAQGSGGTYQPVKDGAGNSYSLTVAAAQFIPIDPVKMSGVRFMKIVSGSTEAAERTLQVVSKPI